MLKDLVSLLIGRRVVVSSAPGNGASSFSLYMLNTILEEERLVLYYNPSRDIDREFVEKYYPRVYKHAVWLECPVDDFLEYFQFSGSEYDCIVIDPGDTTMINKQIVPQIGHLRRRDSTFIVTSQIRQDPNKGWAPYSTIEKLNSFDYSIWIRNATAGHPVFILKYVDIYTEIRSGSNFKLRDVAHYTKEGNIVELS